MPHKKVSNVGTKFISEKMKTSADNSAYIMQHNTYIIQSTKQWTSRGMIEVFERTMKKCCDTKARVHSCLTH